MGNHFEELKKHFSFPFPPHDFQEVSLSEIVIRDTSLLKYKVGLGKTFTSILAALYYSLDDGVEQILVLCPPILLDQWYEFLMQIKGIPDVLLYRGTPKEREEMDLDVSVVLVSYNIFRGKRDHKKFEKMLRASKTCIIADELSLKNLKSKIYKQLKLLLYRKMRLTQEDKPFHKLIALNATPLSDLGHVYNWCSLFVPGIYGSKRLFEFTHVEEQDHWGTVTEWSGEDIMQRNMNLFSIDTDKEVKLPPLIETVVPYELTPAHSKLYEEVKDAQLSALPVDKIELAINSMFSTLQRLVLVPREYGLDIDSPVMEFIYGYLDQLQEGDQLIIFTRHVDVSRLLHSQIKNSAAVYGEVTGKRRQRYFKGLKNGEIKVLVANMDSCGHGLNLEYINHVIFAELPFRSDRYTQSVGRVYRQGQDKTSFINAALAKDTLQYKIFHRLIKNKESIDRVIKTKDQVARFLNS